jgi:hypothetical protein
MLTTNKRTQSDDNDNEHHHSPRPTSQTVFESSPITDRASTFVAHFHPHDANQANDPTTGKPTSSSLTQTVKAFQNNAAFSSADHRIAAWRRSSSQRTLLTTLNAASGAANANRNANANVTYTTSSDDDGEKYAGKRLERVLNELNVQGIVVVARWYGGVMLGPVRFTHIENVAREAIMKWKRSVASSGGVGDDSGGGTDRSKRLKFDDGSSSPSSSAAAGAAATPAQKAAEEAHRLRLVEQLAHRDNSIVVLRSLLAEKKEMKEKRTNVAALPPSTSISTSSSEPSKLETNHDGGGSGSQTPPQPTSSAAGDVDVVVRTTPASASSSPAPAPVPAKPQAMDYSQMPLQRLRQLEKARDATIAFILKQIDKAEEEEEQEKQKGKDAK